VPVGAPDFRNVLEARQSAVTARGAKGKTRAKRAQKP
jgi:hypothetical protein